jgi:hypothetical protein
MAGQGVMPNLRMKGTAKKKIVHTKDKRRARKKGRH